VVRRAVLLMATASLVLGGVTVGTGPAGAADAAGRPSFLLAEHPRVQYVLTGEAWQATGDLAGPGHRPYVVQEGGPGSWHTVQVKRSRAGGGVTIRIVHAQQGRYQMRAVARRWHGLGRAISRTLIWHVVKLLNQRQPAAAATH
jgi:hypothetical protein